MSYTIRKHANIDEAEQLELYEQGVQWVTTEYQSIAILAKIVLKIIEQNDLKISDRDFKCLIELFNNFGYLTDIFVKQYKKTNDD